MSNTFRGITFSDQAVTPSDDAIVRRAILPDGILTGCEVSYSGSTLTMASGYIIACGRTLHHVSAENWAVTGATSGFARLVLTLDLTRTATESTFDQILTEVQYASAEDGFTDLEQSDINLSGSRYQISVCVVSLGRGGITGIVSKLELSRVEGGGGLNFNVVGGLTQPADHKENTIWVETDVPITGYTFSSTAPADPVEGMVWISVGASSTVAFSAVVKNPIMVYPIAAKQYVGGAWVDKTAKIYQGGEWVEWVTYLYNAGNEFTDLSGGWGAFTYHDKNNLSSTSAGDRIVMTYERYNTYSQGWLSCKKAIDLTNVKTVHLTYDKANTNAKMYFVVGKNQTGNFNGTVTTDHPVSHMLASASGKATASIDVSALAGNYFVKVGGSNSTRDDGVGEVVVNVYSVWVE